MSDERLRILKLLEEGKITADEAYRLLKAYEEKAVAGSFVIKVRDGDEKVNIRIPLSVVRASLKLGGGILKIIPEGTLESLEDKEIDIEALLDELSKSIPEKPTTIMEVTSEDGEYVYIGIE